MKEPTLEQRIAALEVTVRAILERLRAPEIASEETADPLAAGFARFMSRPRPEVRNARDEG